MRENFRTVIKRWRRDEKSFAADELKIRHRVGRHLTRSVEKTNALRKLVKEDYKDRKIEKGTGTEVRTLVVCKET